MSENSHHLQMPYIMPSQAQKHVTHNEALRMLDAIVQLSVDGTSLSEPPSSPVEGERHIIATGATGDWSGKDNQIAAFIDGAWMYFAPQEGWLAWDKSADKLLAFGNSAWGAVGGGGGNASDQMAFLGINGVATQSERLVVQSESILFNHDGDSHRLKLNKAAAADTASLLFQTGFEGRAEFGLPGNDEFAVKVSSDGAEWHDAMRIDNATGEISFPKSGIDLNTNLFTNLLPDSGRFTASSSQHFLTDASPVMPGYLSSSNSSTISFPFQFLHNNNTYGGTRGFLDPVVDDLIVKIFGPGGLRYGPEFHVMQIDAGSGTSAPLTIDGEQYFHQTLMGANPRPGRYSSGFFVRAESGKIALRSPYGEVRKLLRDGVSVDYLTAGVVVDPADGWVYFELQVTADVTSYERNDITVNMLTGSVGYLALPRVVSGWVSIGSNTAILANDRIFQP